MKKKKAFNGHGECPTCGHCKCCEKNQHFTPYYPQFPYQPIWIDNSPRPATWGEPILTCTASTGFIIEN